MTIALIICIIGGIIYAVCSERASIPAFVAEMGRLAFFAGLLAYLLGK